MAVWRRADFVRRSTFDAAPPADAARADIWLGDTEGEMPTYYGSADVALLGGSFRPGAERGAGAAGADVVEACACGCPSVAGPFAGGTHGALNPVLSAGAARRADSMAEAVSTAVAMAGDGNRNPWVERAFAFARTHRGAAERTAREVLRVFNAGAAVGPEDGP